MTVWQYNRTVVGNDAIGNSIRFLDTGLREAGRDTQIVVAETGSDQAGSPHPLLPELEARVQPSDTVLVHYSFYDPDVNRLLRLPARRIMIYHNITPGRFFADAGMTGIAGACDAGRAQLHDFAPRFDTVVCDSQFNRDDLPAQTQACAQVIPVLTAHEAFASRKVSAFKIAALRVNYKIVCLSVGRLVPNKDLAHLLHVLADLRERFGVDACLLIVGKTWDATYTASLHALATQLGIAEHVQWLGNVADADLPACFRAADVYLQASEHEGFGIPVLESMAIALPVIALNVGATPEILGGTGVLLDSKIVHLWSAVILEIATNRQLRREITFMQHRATERFKLSSTIQAWNALLRESP